MAQSVSYGSQFKPYASTNTQSYGAYRPLAASLAGSPYYYGGGPYPQPAAQSPYYYGGGQASTTVTYPFDSSVAPADKAPQAQAPASTFDPSAGAQAPPGGPGMSDLATDPILQQIQAAGVQAEQNARSAAMRNAENALIGYGSTTVPDAVRSAYGADQTDPVLAALTDAATQQAAAANPDSTLMRLANQNTQNQAKLNTGLNANNLFYSSTRGNDLGELANQYRSAQNDAAALLAAMLGNQEQNVLGARGTAQSNYLNALQGAWERWMALHPPAATYINSGYGPSSSYGGASGDLIPGTLSPGNYGAAPTMADTTGLSPADAIAALQAKDAAKAAWTQQLNNPTGPTRLY
jgi:hypothetical protein